MGHTPYKLAKLEPELSGGLEVEEELRLLRDHLAVLRSRTSIEDSNVRFRIRMLESAIKDLESR